MNIKPLHDYVAVKPLDEEDVTKSGIVLPDTVSKEKPEKGEVIAISEKKKNDDKAKTLLNVGDTVVFKKFSPEAIVVDGEDVLLVRESDIMAVIK